MFTKANPHAAAVLRVALITPLVYGMAGMLGTPMPYIAAFLFALFALKLPAAPPVGVIAVLAVLLFVLPTFFAGVAAVLLHYPYLMVGFVGFVFFHAFRLQDRPQTALIGVLMQTFVIMLPLMTGQSELAATVVSGAYATNGLVAVAGLCLAFAVFPSVAATPAGTTDPAQVAPARSHLISALVMLPPFTLLLGFDLSSAMRIVFTIAVVLTSLNRRDVHETGAESVLSAIFAGVVALAFTVLHLLWPQPVAALLAMAFLGLVVVPHAYAGRNRGAVALAIPLVWVLLGTAEGNTAIKTLQWCLYSTIGVLYAVWAHALITRLFQQSPMYQKYK